MFLTQSEGTPRRNKGQYSVIGSGPGSEIGIHAHELSSEGNRTNR